MKKKLREKKGSIFVYSVIISLAMFLIISALTEYFRLKTITSHIEDSLQSAVISTVIDNYENIFSSNREGYISGFLYDEYDAQWKGAVDYGDIYAELNGLLGLERDGNYYVKLSDGVEEFRLSDLEVTVKSSPLQTGSGSKIKAESSINFEMPYSAMWGKLPPLRLRLKTDSEQIMMF